MKYDHDILYQFIPTDHKQRFLTWNNAYQSIEGINIVGVYTVHYGVNSRAPFEERILIPFSLYKWIKLNPDDYSSLTGKSY